MSAHNPTDEDKTIPFYPDHVRTELKVALGILLVAGVIGVLALFSPVGLGDPADPFDTPAHVKPEWYFLGLYQLLKYIPKTTGAVLPVLAVLLILVWPFLDRVPDRNSRPQRIRLIVTAVIMFILVALTIWGEVS